MGSTPFGGKNVKGNIAEAGANSKFTCVERQHHTPVLFRGQLPKFGAVLRAWFSGAVLDQMHRALANKLAQYRTRLKAMSTIFKNCANLTSRATMRKLYHPDL
jgi:hypothetical protein